MSNSLGDIAISNIKGVDYRCIISGIDKSEAINLMLNIDLTEKTRILYDILWHIKIGKEILTFGDIEIEKIIFTVIKVLFFLEDVDPEKVLVSNKIFPCEKNYKYFIGFLYNDHKVKPLYIMLPKTSAYVKKWWTN